tara:strand:+ start:1033 stop:1143 length:111 start_codon:yes stop_codon:yes gene_type:complete
MYRNGLKTKVVLKKRALRKLIQDKAKELQNRFNYGL